jgi:hypothetical protein
MPRLDMIYLSSFVQWSYSSSLRQTLARFHLLSSVEQAVPAPYLLEDRSILFRGVGSEKSRFGAGGLVRAVAASPMRREDLPLLP